MTYKEVVSFMNKQASMRKQAETYAPNSHAGATGNPVVNQSRNRMADIQRRYAAEMRHSQELERYDAERVRQGKPINYGLTVRGPGNPRNMVPQEGGFSGTIKRFPGELWNEIKNPSNLLSSVGSGIIISPVTAYNQIKSVLPKSQDHEGNRKGLATH